MNNIKQNEEEDIYFWHGIVEITQIPNNLEKIYAEGISWLTNPFQDSQVYATKYSIKPKGFSWKFYMKTKARDKAIRIAQTFLSYLKELFTGLDGIVKAKAIKFHHLRKTRPYLQELILPNPPYIKNRAPLIQRIMNIAESNTKHGIKIYIFWQFTDQESNSILRDSTKCTLKYDFYYNLRVIIETKPVLDDGIEGETEFAELLGSLDYLVADILNRTPHRAILTESEVKAPNLLTLEKLFNRQIRVGTSIYDDDSRVFTKKMNALDFSIPPNTPLDKAITIINEKIGKPVKEPRILLGKGYQRGVLTKSKKYLHLHDLVHHIFISGLSGSGKSSYMAHTTREIKKHGKNIGVLIINLVKKGEEKKYAPDIILRKGDIDFRVPYFISHKNYDAVCKQVAAYLVASLGLKNVIVSITKKILIDNYEKLGVPPRFPDEVFGAVLAHLKNNRYHHKFHTNITEAIKNRVMSLLSSENIKNILELGPVPRWFIEFMNGKTVYIDLHEFEDGKSLITHAIFQMMRTLLPELEDNELKYVILFDEANEISQRTKNQSVNDDETITRHYLEIVFEKLLRAFRSRGVGAIIADHLPRLLFEGVYKLPSIKIIFRSDKDFLPFITNYAEEQDALANQENRRALILDGVNARKFAIYTPDFTIERKLTYTEEIQTFCPNCDVLIEKNLTFCKKCGCII